MKILMVCEFFAPDLEFQENTILKYYLKHGHEVRILTSTYTSVFDYYSCNRKLSTKETSFVHNGGLIVRLPYRYNFLYKVRSFRDVRRHLADFRPDFIYVHDVSPDFPNLIQYMRKNPRCKMVMDCHADFSNSGKSLMSRRLLHGVIRRYFLDRARPYLSKIFPVVPNGFDFLNQVYKVPTEEMELLPLGADHDLIDDLRRRQASGDLKARLNLSDEHFVIVTGGKIEPRKRIELLIEAISSDQFANVRLLVVGEFPPNADIYRTRIKNSASALGERVQFVGWQDVEGVYQHLCVADIAVFPASQSVLWQKAIACGLPLICGDTGNQDISYLNRYDSIRILRGDEICVDILREQIFELMNSSDLVRQMSNASERVGREMLNWDAMTEQTLRFRHSE